MKCPRCNVDLFANFYEGVEIDTCVSCRGDWLDLDELTKIIENEETQFSSELVRDTIRKEYSGIPEEEALSELSCPKCDGVMHPVNYSYSSGIIIDRCADHGIWLDRGELDKVQINRETWAKKALDSKDHWEEMVAKVAAEQTVIDPSEGISNFSIINRIIHFINNIS